VTPEIHPALDMPAELLSKTQKLSEVAWGSPMCGTQQESIHQGDPFDISSQWPQEWTDSQLRAPMFNKHGCLETATPK
jgi:hypothetical protein